MAEAIVDGTSSMSRFFCHRCSVEIEHLLPDYKCPKCSTGFIEELERSSADNRSSADIDMQELSDLEVDVTGYDEFSNQYDLPMTILRAAQVASRGSGGWNNGNRTGGQSTSRNSRNQQQQQGALPPQIDNLLQDLFLNLSSFGFTIPQGQGGQSVFDVRLFMGNPGDYVWGQNGLDSIVTQLLNQMDGTGPPPLPKKQIDEIPIVTILQAHVDRKSQCSVCWEDFVLSESVRQLPCQHFYHTPCIVPWLELHGTCPICRQSLGEQTTSEANQDTVGPSLAALFRAADESNSGRASTGNDSRNNTPNNS